MRHTSGRKRDQTTAMIASQLKEQHITTRSSFFEKILLVREIIKKSGNVDRKIKAPFPRKRLFKASVGLKKNGVIESSQERRERGEKLAGYAIEPWG